MIILNLGAGVQSTTVLLMSQKGILPKIDHAVFADTGAEPETVYKHLEWLKQEAKDIPIHVTSAGNLETDLINSFQNPTAKPTTGRKGFARIPLFILNPPKPGKNSTVGIMMRQCTRDYKVRPIEQYIKRNILGLAPRKWVPKSMKIEQWFGISMDEVQRTRISTHKWAEFVYPLCGPKYNKNYLPQALTRQDCLDWLKEHYPDLKPIKSACYFCPFRDKQGWADLNGQDPEAFRKAVEMEALIQRHNFLEGVPYLSKACKPLSELHDFPSFAFNEECEGHCGV